VSVPRGTLSLALRDARLSVRVPLTLKARVRELVAELQARGLRTSESELVELFVEQGLSSDVDAVDGRLRGWRGAQERR